MYNRGFKTVNTAQFDQVALEKDMNEEREVFGEFHPDSRCKKNVIARAGI